MLPEFILLVPEPEVPVEFIVPEPEVPVEFIVPKPAVPEVVPVPVALLVPVVVPARVVESAAWTTANTLAIEKAAAAVVMTTFDTFMMDLLKNE